MSNLSKVAIVGRTNVGKSTLFNRLSESVKTLTLDFCGVTRDFVKDTVSWNGSTFELIDSGGLVLRKTQDVIDEKVRQIALNMVKESDVAIFVCDGTVGVLPEDIEIAKLLRQLDKKVILVINKADTKIAQENEFEFQKFGFKQSVFISAQHGTGIGDLLDLIVENLGQKANRSDDEEPIYKITLLGKPNVGKSSLLNILLEEERSIVTDIPGTTREAISEKIRFYKESIQITDTAGVRRKRSVTETLETLMVKSTFDAVKNSDIVLLLLDVSMAEISDQELKLAFYVFEQGKALILLFNKEDLLDPEKKKDLEYSLSPYEYFMKKVEVLNISCKSGKNIGRILPLVTKVWARYSHHFTDIELTELFKIALTRKPLYHKTLPLVVYAVRQVKNAPITLVLFVNNPAWFDDSHKAFFENTMRAKYDLKSAPIIFMIRKRG